MAASQEVRAPPPSPIANAAECLEQPLPVPELLLPQSTFAREISAGSPPVVDFQSLVTDGSRSAPEFLESVAEIGCFQLVNCGISCDLLASARRAAAAVFEVSDEKKAELQRSADRRCGFEEAAAEMNEEFWWCRGDEHEGNHERMEGIWPNGFSTFSRKTESLCATLEEIAQKLLQILQQRVQHSGSPKEVKKLMPSGERVAEKVSPMLCIRKNGCNLSSEKWVRFVQLDIIRMLIQPSDFSHHLSLHLCDGASEFHLHSKRGWMSFFPAKDAVVVTIGDQTQEQSNGFYKQAIGRPVPPMKGEESISMAFIYSQPPAFHQCWDSGSTCDYKLIPLSQQMIIAVCLILICQFMIYILS